MLTRWPTFIYNGYAFLPGTVPSWESSPEHRQPQWPPLAPAGGLGGRCAEYNTEIDNNGGDGVVVAAS